MWTVAYKTLMYWQLLRICWAVEVGAVWTTQQSTTPLATSTGPTSFASRTSTNATTAVKIFLCRVLRGAGELPRRILEFHDRLGKDRGLRLSDRHAGLLGQHNCSLLHLLPPQQGQEQLQLLLQNDRDGLTYYSYQSLLYFTNTPLLLILHSHSPCILTITPLLRPLVVPISSLGLKRGVYGNEL